MNYRLHLLLAACLFSTSLRAEVRTFTSAAGTTLKGELVSVSGDAVTIKKEDGQMLTLKAAAFSRVDQVWLETQGLKTATTSSAAPNPAGATKDNPFVNSVGMKFVPVPETNILMCIHETRRSDYAAYAAANRGVNDAWKKTKIPGMKTPEEALQHPVAAVSWEDAKAFCDWLSKEESRSYRLPLDHEWSLAVGAAQFENNGNSPSKYNQMMLKLYPWGREWPIPSGAGNYHDITRIKAIKPKATDKGADLEGYLNGYGYTDGYVGSAPVMSFKPNALGLYDLGGNVWEACADDYNDVGRLPVYRGNSFCFSTYDERDNMRANARIALPRDTRIDHAGFRVVMLVNP